MKKNETIRDQSVDELRVSYRELTAEIFHLKNELSVHRKLEKPHLLSLKKRERARVLTFLSQKSEKLS